MKMSPWKRTMIKKLGSEEAVIKWCSEIGSKGGSVRVPKGFAINRQLASEAGRIGGMQPKKRKNKDVN